MQQFIKNISFRSKDFFIFFIAINMLIVVMFSIYGDIFTGHDYYFHMERIKSLSRALQEGNYPHYIDYDAVDGYGYLVRAFYPDMTLIPFAYISQFIGFVSAYKLMIYVTTILSAFFMYHMLIRITKEYNIALIGSLLYTFCYYRLFDVFLRAAVGEFLAITFIPLVFLGLYYIIYDDSRKWYYLSFGAVLILFSHLITTLIVSFFCFIFVLSQYKKMSDTKRLKHLLIAILAIIAISSIFILPFFQHYIDTKYYFQVDLKDPLAEEGLGTLTYLLGFIAGIKPLFRSLGVGTGLLLTLCLLSRVFIRKNSRLLKVADILTVIGLLVTLTCHKLFPWYLFPALDFIQFPWRLYTMVSFFFSISGAIYLFELSYSKNRKIAVYTFVSVTIIALMALSREEFSDRRLDTQYDRIPDFSNHFNQVGMEYLPAKVPSLDFLVERGSKVITNSGDVIDPISRNKGVLAFDASVDEETKFELPLLYYRGYEAMQGNDMLVITESDNGLVQVTTKNSGKIIIKYIGTFIDRTSWIISFVSFILLFLYIFFLKKSIFR